MNKTYTKEQMLNYLQQMMDDFMKWEKYIGGDNKDLEEFAVHKMDAMIACKEMVEAFIQEPVNLQTDGKVTVGF